MGRNKKLYERFLNCFDVRMKQLTELKQRVFPKKTKVEIYHGDCVEGMALLPAKSVDLVVTSPPYNLGIKYSAYKDDQARQQTGGKAHRVEPDRRHQNRTAERPPSDLVAADHGRIARRQAGVEGRHRVAVRGGGRRP